MYTLVMAHNDPAARATYERHKASYGEHEVYSPKDKPLRVANEQSYGMASHHGAAANARFKMALAICAYHGEAIIHEYDSLCLDRSYIDECQKWGVWCNLFRDTDPRRKFEGTHFTHPVLLFRGDALAKLMPVIMKMPDAAEGGFWDRFLGRACEIANVPMHNYERGFSRNTIEPGDDASFKRALENGACMIHGVKRKETSELALRYYRKEATHG